MVKQDTTRGDAEAEADGESFFVERTGTAKGAEVRSVGLERAEGFCSRRPLSVSDH